MMDDKELLERAAKAAGIDGYFASDDQDDRDEYWNPLTNNGDALRLAVDLRMQVQVNEAAVVVETWQSDIGETKEIVEYFDQQDDVYAATRRAIVRAGATKCST